ncbi:M23 family metallopeptidase [Sulfurivirga sp.]|uniref:M23 family metallopeptidase n=1 Tax=Sulfurivirga sp. TaxID=2614236 RepID=UPI0025FF9776|nr:M23 family metallopeptidase [Sulfurivirga sp.]
MRGIFFLLLLCWSWMSLAAASEPEAVRVEGVLKPGGWAVVTAPAGSKLHYGGHVVKFDRLGQLPVGFARDSHSPAQLVVNLPNGGKVVRQITLAPRHYDIQRINGLKKKYVSPDPKTLAKIRADIAAARAARKRFLRQVAGWRERPFLWPVGGIVTGVYGSQRILNGKPRRPHFGVDIAAPRGTAVHAPADGVVTLAQKMVLSGNTLMIDHGYGLRSTFMHLSRLFVKPGERVRRGEKVAEVGATGRATGPHLHWGMSWFSTRLDPTTFVGVAVHKGDRVRALTSTVERPAGK